MDFLDRASRFVQDVGENVVNSARSVGSSVLNAGSEQRELAGLKVQLDAVNKKLDAYYSRIGRKYVEYMENCATEESFSVEEIVEQMKSDLAQKAEIEAKIAAKEQEIRDMEVERERQRAQERFDREKKKLEDALRMDVITVEEYEEKLAKAQKRLDHFRELRKLELQYTMQIITKEEYEKKVEAILG